MSDSHNKANIGRCLRTLRRLPARQFLICLVLLQFTPQISNAEPTPFRAVYRATYKGLPFVAEGVRELTRLGEDSYMMTNSVTSWIASISEQSVFTWHPSDGLQPEEYQYHRRGIGSNRDAILKFDWSINQVLNDVQSKPWKMALPDGAMDKLGYQIKMRFDLQNHYSQSDQKPDLRYLIADGGRLKTYSFEILAEEEIDTPVGRISTLKIARRRDNDKRSTIFWLAKDWDFLLVRLEQGTSGKRSFNLSLKEATVDGTDVKGS
jgi:hypothetical protein